MCRFGLLIFTAAFLLFTHHAGASSLTGQEIAQKLMQQSVKSQFLRNYSFDEIKNNYEIRRRLNEIEIPSIVFKSNWAQLLPKDYRKLQGIAQALKIILSRKPQEFFLIEGHTDSPGNKLYNQRLSYLRALNIKQILVNAYGIPAANLAAAGYGEVYLKIKVKWAEPRNRRVTLRRITPALLSRAMGKRFMPTLLRRNTLPFSPPNIMSPFAKPQMKSVTKPKPQSVPFRPRLLVRPSLPFTPPNVMSPFPTPQMKPVTKPKPQSVPFRPRLLVRPDLPFTPPSVKSPFAKPAAKPQATPAPVKPQAKVFIPRLMRRQILPFTPPMATPPFAKPAVKPQATPALAKPQAKVFIPRLMRRQALPFTPPMATPPFAYTQAVPLPRRKPQRVMLQFVPRLLMRQALPFTLPYIKSPFAEPQLRPAPKMKPQMTPFVPNLLMRPSLPFTPPNAVKPF